MNQNEKHEAMGYRTSNVYINDSIINLTTQHQYINVHIKQISLDLVLE